jgi:RNA polymerase sigma-70 factor (ECF subfamily)
MGGALPDEPDPDAPFAAWVAPHLPVLAAIAVREVGAVHADDVVQEALIRAWGRRATFRAERGSVRAWLVAILLDQARRYRMRTLRTRPSAAVVPDSGGESVDDRLVVERAVCGLPRRQRQVVTLFYLADLPIAEIADLLGTTPSAVKVHLHAARAALRKTLDPT